MGNNLIKIFKALGDETRLKIVQYLLLEEKCACDFSNCINKDQTTISRHLKILVEAGILNFKKDGRNVIFQIKNKQIKNMLDDFGIKPYNNCCFKKSFK